MNFSDSPATTAAALMGELETSKRIIYALVKAAGGRARVEATALVEMTEQDALAVEVDGAAYVLTIVRKEDLLEKKA